MISDNLKKIMKEKNIRSKELAEKLDITPAHLSYVLNRKRNISLELAQKIADVFNISISTLFKTGDEDACLLFDNQNSALTPEKPKDLLKILEQEDYTLNGQVVSQEDRKRLQRIIQATYYDTKEQNKEST